MKRAWVTVQEWEKRPVGHIERISDLENWPIYCVNNGWVVGIDFDDTWIDIDYAKAVYENDQWVIIEDTERKTEAENKRRQEQIIQTAELRMEYGNKVLSYFSIPFVRDYLYEDPSKLFLLPEIQKLRNYLLYGYLEDARNLLLGLPNDILPQILMDLMLEKLTQYIDQTTL